MTTRASYGMAGIAALTVALFIAGCGTTTVEKMTSCGDDHIGYWAAATGGNASLQQFHASRIAAGEFALRKKPKMPATLHELRAYRTLLLAPVEARTALPAQSPDLRSLPPGETKRIQNHITAHMETRFIDGAKCVKEWAAEIGRITALIPGLEEKVAGIIREGEAHLRGGDIAKVDAALQEARKLDNDGPSVIKFEKQILIAGCKGKLDTLADGLAGQLQKVTLMQAAFGEAGSTAEGVKSCLDLLEQAERSIRQFKDELQTASGEKFTSDEVDKALQDAEVGISTMQGKCWGEQIRLMGRNRLFWAAYQYADERLKGVSGLPEYRKRPAGAQIEDAYGKMLPAALAHHVNAANSHFAQDAYGIALVLCRMGDELVQFARQRQIQIPDEALIWERRCLESLSDAQKKISAAVRRRILIGDFTPLTRENQRLASMVYDRCVQAFSESPSGDARIAWGVDVQKVGDKSQPSEYLIACSIPEFMILEQVPVEIERGIIKVGRDIREIQNPAYNPEYNKHVPKTILSQEVYHYQAIRKMHSKKARLLVGMTCLHEGQTRSLLAMDTDFSDSGTKLPGVNMSSVEEQLDAPFIGPPKTATSRKEFSVDPWPKGTAATLSSDAEISAAMQKVATEAIVDRIASLASTYPVEVLAAEAVRQAKLGNKYEAANAWGQCLEYCCQLAAQKDPEASWFQQKEAMSGRVADLCRTTWKDCSGDLLRKMPDLWSEAARSASEVSPPIR